uniref:Uncharacterized protein n=1 Tax=Sphaerodactylus townsendi TaxID=933632 RepID=A0ACB8F5U0_9SAUR
MAYEEQMSLRVFYSRPARLLIKLPFDLPAVETRFLTCTLKFAVPRRACSLEEMLLPCVSKTEALQRDILGLGLALQRKVTMSPMTRCLSFTPLWSLA